ncbi:MAG TPA: hypothetical protein VH280_19475 [Verrucomicrobiae bacterium]|jgi:hypothetical protein|nr:hypothetical protein [Verrucomicrobiae bacterium]
MSADSISLPDGFAEIRVRGKTTFVPSATIEGRTVISTGKWLKTAIIRDQDYVDGELVKDPASFVAALKKSGLKADLFTFFQRPPEVAPKFNFHVAWDNYAAVPVETFKKWWEGVPQETRKNVRRSAKRGVEVKAVPFDDELARGIHNLCNETPVRQGKPFWHFGKDFETVKREHSTYLEQSDFIGAFFENQLIGFIKIIYVDRLAHILHILAANAHYDKRPINGLIAKAVEICEQKGAGYFVYGQYTYGNKTQSSLVELKRRNGFEQINFPRYYVPLTWKGRMAVAFRLYRGAVGLLPSPVLKMAVATRDWLYKRNAPVPAAERSTETKEDAT